MIFVNEVKFNDGLDHLRLSTEEIRKLVKESKADAIIVYQTRNFLHNGHCILLHSARKQLICKGFKKPILLLHPCGGWTKEGDIPLKVRIKQYEALFESFVLNRNNFILAVWPAPMFYAGPAEVQWHFSSRQFAGVNYMIVGRDPAGIKDPDNPTEDLYEPHHGQEVN